MTEQTIGANLAYVREAMGHTQSSLARKSGVPQPTLSAIERGARNPTIGLLIRIKRALGCEWPALLRGLD